MFYLSLRRLDIMSLAQLHKFSTDTLWRRIERNTMTAEQYFLQVPKLLRLCWKGSGYWPWLGEHAELAEASHRDLQQQRRVSR